MLWLHNFCHLIYTPHKQIYYSKNKQTSTPCQSNTFNVANFPEETATGAHFRSFWTSSTTVAMAALFACSTSVCAHVSHVLLPFVVNPEFVLLLMESTATTYLAKSALPPKNCNIILYIALVSFRTSSNFLDKLACSFSTLVNLNAFCLCIFCFTTTYSSKQHCPYYMYNKKLLPAHKT